MEFARDLAIIVVAVESFVAIGVLIILVLKVMSLVDTVQAEVPVLMASARRTVNTVEGTASFVSKKAVMPIIKVTSMAAATSKFTQVILGLEKPKRR